MDIPAKLYFIFFYKIQSVPQKRRRKQATQTLLFLLQVFRRKKISLACEFRGGPAGFLITARAAASKITKKAGRCKPAAMICHKDGSSKSRLPKLICAAPYPKQQIQTHAPPIGGAFLLRRDGAAPPAYLPFWPVFSCFLAFRQAGQRTGSFSKPFSLKKKLFAF